VGDRDPAAQLAAPQGSRTWTAKAETGCGVLFDHQKKKAGTRGKAGTTTGPFPFGRLREPVVEAVDRQPVGDCAVFAGAAGVVGVFGFEARVLGN